MTLNVLFESQTHRIESEGVINTTEPSYKISRLAYSLRIGDDEKDIEVAAETDVEIRVLIKRLDRAEYVDLSDPLTISMLDLLVSKSSLPNFGEDRKAEILNEPIKPSEVYIV